MKNTSRFSILCFSLILFSLSSCFDIKEKVFIRKDGSGTFSFTIDLGQSKLFMDMAKRMTDGTQESPVDKINTSFDENKAELEKIKGITNVQSIFDDHNYTYGFQFDFANVQALNLAISKTLGKEEKGEKSFAQYHFSKGTFERIEEATLKSKIESELNKKDGDHGAAFSAATFFHDVRYIAEYTFESKVKSVDQSSAQISPDGKTVTLTQMIFNEDDNVKSLKSKILF